MTVVTISRRAPLLDSCVAKKISYKRVHVSDVLELCIELLGLWTRRCWRLSENKICGILASFKFPHI